MTDFRDQAHLCNLAAFSRSALLCASLPGLCIEAVRGPPAKYSEPIAQWMVRLQSLPLVHDTNSGGLQTATFFGCVLVTSACSSFPSSFMSLHERSSN